MTQPQTPPKLGNPPRPRIQTPEYASPDPMGCVVACMFAVMIVAVLSVIISGRINRPIQLWEVRVVGGKTYRIETQSAPLISFGGLTFDDPETGATVSTNNFELERIQ